MINRDVQSITSRFGNRTLNGEKQFHYGIDLRSVNMETYQDQEVLAPEECRVLRVGIDRTGNGFLVVEPIDNKYYRELKFIHIDDYALDNFSPGDLIVKGSFLGYCVIGGTSKAKHLHFETWVAAKGNTIRPCNPVEYLIDRRIKFNYV